VVQGSQLLLGAPNREVSEILCNETFQVLLGSVATQELKFYADALVSSDFEEARACLQRLMQSLNVSQRPDCEAQFAVFAVSALTLLPQFKGGAVYVQFRQTLGGESGKKAKIPDCCIVYPDRRPGSVSGQMRALVIELKYGSSDQSAQKGMAQIYDRDYMTRARQYVQQRLGAELPESATSAVSFSLSQEMLVTMALPPKAAQST